MFRKTYSSITLSIIFSTISLSTIEATEVENIQYDKETGSLDKNFDTYTTVGNIQASQGTINVAFEKGGVVQGSITSHQATWSTRNGTNNIIFKSPDPQEQKNQILGDISLLKGINYITMEGKNEIFGNIKVENFGYRAKNSLLLKGESSQLGKNDKKINLSSKSGLGKESRFNYLKLSSTTNTLYIDKIEAYFTPNPKVPPYSSSNIISLDGSSNNTATISMLKASGNYAVNAIGKNILTTTMDNSTAKDLKTDDGFMTNPLDSKYQVMGTLTIANTNQDAIIATSGGKNLIAYQNIDITGNIDANVGQNYINTEKLSLNGNITARSGGKNYIAINNNANKENSKSGTATQKQNNLSIQLISANNGHNYIGKNTSAMKFINDSNAFEGVLQVGSMSSTNGGTNNISYKASDKILSTNTAGLKLAQNAIVGSLTSNPDAVTIGNLNTVVSGNNNLYLDLSKNTDFANVSNLTSTGINKNTQAIIIGNIDNQIKEANNIKIVGGNSEGTVAQADKMTTNDTYIKTGLIGNITTNGGTNNLIFENSIWLPSYIITNTKMIDIPKNLSGTLINKNGGTTNLVLRTSSATLNNLGTSMFNIQNESGQVNVVVQGQFNVGANVTYGDNTNGSTTFIFANSNDINGSTKDSFDNNSTTIDNNKVLGVTYQDGIKLVLQDKIIKTNDKKNISFLATYKNYFISKDTDPVLTLTTSRTNNSNFKDTIVIEGLFVGDLVALQRSETNKDKHADLNITLKTNSAFFGGFDFSNLLKTQGQKGDSGT
ncbi:hypothetical protein, partial [Helicobacter anatolicus]|uniref:hypothetical protein n=1 Tax=Helicobacter anatolicus TaxID=2905874 RepID=UPI001E33ED8C